jgi:hypothetical protein
MSRRSGDKAGRLSVRIAIALISPSLLKPKYSDSHVWGPRSSPIVVILVGIVGFSAYLVAELAPATV